jgi:hypothetical protein
MLSTNADSLIRLHDVKVFERAVSMVHDMAEWYGWDLAGRYGWALAMPVLTKASVAWLLAWFSPRCENNYV